MKKKTVILSLRLPENVHERIVKLAEKEKRSMNKQMVYILEVALNEKDK